jgi:hypothetical protein
MLRAARVRAAPSTSVYTSQGSYDDSIQRKRKQADHKDFSQLLLYDIYLKAPIQKSVSNLPMADGQDQHIGVNLSDMKTPKKR